MRQAGEMAHFDIGLCPTVDCDRLMILFVSFVT